MSRLSVLGAHEQWPERTEFWPSEIEVALTDAIYSANANYGSARSDDRGATGVFRVIEVLRTKRGEGNLDNLPALIDLLENDPPFVLGNESCSPGVPTKKETNLRLIAEALVAADVSSGRDVKKYIQDSGGFFWPRHPKQGRVGGVAGATWSYFLINLGYPRVKADRMICRFVSEAIGREANPELAASLVTRAAEQSAVPVVDLDFAIWSYQRRQG